MAVHYLGDGNPDGVTMGIDATEKISFFGATPVVQPTVTAPAATATTTTNEAAIVSINNALVSLGLVVTA